MKDLYLIHGFYRSGLGLASNAVKHCGGRVISWPTQVNLSSNFEGVKVEAADLVGLHSILKKQIQSEPIFIQCTSTPDSWSVFHELKEYNVSHILIYRPLEQVVDSITRRRIQEIFLTKKAIGRIFSMRKFQKLLPGLQLSIKKQFIDFYSSATTQIENNSLSFSIVQTSNFIESMTSCFQNIQEKSGYQFDHEKLSSYFDQEKFVFQKAIDNYRDEELKKIHAALSQSSKNE